MRRYFALGSYTEAILFGTGEVFQGKGKGISICALEDGKIELLTEIVVRNPSFLCIDESNRKLYAVNEMKEYLGSEGGGLTQISYREDLSMEIEGTWNLSGKDPCHIELSPNGRFLAIANFASGSVTTFSRNDIGNVDGRSKAVFQHVGSSVHPIRQRGPHAHSCVFSRDRNLLYVPDLGLDQVVTYGFEDERLSIDKELSVTVPAGSGPRYGEFSADGTRFYLINEISSQVMFFTCEEGRLQYRQTVETLPSDFSGDNICSDLHLTPDGTKLYASNRGHNSIVCYQVEGDGTLTFIERQPCGGRTPRNFAIDPDGAYLLVGNQDSDTICVFRIESNGHLSMTSVMHTGSPVCIRFLNP